MLTLLGILLLLAIVAGVVWLGSRSKPSGGNGDNRDAATRCGAGPR